MKIRVGGEESGAKVDRDEEEEEGKIPYIGRIGHSFVALCK